MGYSEHCARVTDPNSKTTFAESEFSYWIFCWAITFQGSVESPMGRGIFPKGPHATQGAALELPGSVDGLNQLAVLIDAQRHVSQARGCQYAIV